MMILLRIRLNQGSMLINKKKDFHRGSQRHFLKARLPYKKTWVKLKCLYQEIFFKPGLRYSNFWVGMTLAQQVG